MKDRYIVESEGKILGYVKADRSDLAAKQVRKKFWPKGSQRFNFSVTIDRTISIATACA